MVDYRFVDFHVFMATLVDKFDALLVGFLAVLKNHIKIYQPR